MINGHKIRLALVDIHAKAAEADAAMINGHLRREPETLPVQSRGGRRGDDQWTP